MTTYSAQEMANALNVSRESAYGLLQYMKEAGLAKYKGERPNANGRGKGQHIYEIPVGAGQLIANAIKKLES